MDNLLTLLVLVAALAWNSAANFYQDVDITWGSGRGQILDKGQLITLSLDKASGSGFQSKNEFLFGKFDMLIKLVPGNSAGTVATFYFSSQSAAHDEIDFEFLGNESGQPYTIHTNIFVQGEGNREMEFLLWFDPTKDFHTYSILWNPQRIIFMVDGTPLREFKNMESVGVAFPNKQAMRLYASLWDGEDWATRGGQVKTDWSKAPFVASYRDLNVNACVRSNIKASCGHSAPWFDQKLNAASHMRMTWVQQNYMTYNYCADTKRFPQGLPKECTSKTNSFLFSI